MESYTSRSYLMVIEKLFLSGKYAKLFQMHFISAFTDPPLALLGSGILESSSLFDSKTL